jgi:hypothetical protein
MSAAIIHTECIHSRSCVPAVCWRYFRPIPNTRYNELPFQYTMQLVNILNFRCFKYYWCVTRWLFFREIHIITFGTPFRCTKIKNILLCCHQNTVLSQTQFASEHTVGSTRTPNVPPAHHKHSTSAVNTFCMKYRSWHNITFSISVVISIFVDNYAAF